MSACSQSRLLLVIGFFLLLSLLASPQENPGYWKTWLDEVEPIMTKNERTVFKGLQTEEGRKRFQSLFWKVRDATPGTPENEFMTEYYSRRRYAESRLEGAQYLSSGETARAKELLEKFIVKDSENKNAALAKEILRSLGQEPGAAR